MSKNLYWRRPPVSVEQHSATALETRYVVCRLLFDNDGSVASDEILVRGSVPYHYLRGVRDTTPHEDVRTDLANLLNLVDEHGGAEVWTDE